MVSFFYVQALHISTYIVAFFVNIVSDYFIA